MARYLVKTSHLVVNLESTEELRKLAEVGTVQKDAKVRTLPDGAWVPAAEHPDLADLWGGTSNAAASPAAAKAVKKGPAPLASRPPSLHHPPVTTTTSSTST